MLALAIIVFIVWALCVFAFKIAGLFVHILLILAVIALVMYFARRRRATV